MFRLCGLLMKRRITDHHVHDCGPRDGRHSGQLHAVRASKASRAPSAAARGGRDKGRRASVRPSRRCKHAIPGCCRPRGVSDRPVCSMFRVAHMSPAQQIEIVPPSIADGPLGRDGRCYPPVSPSQRARWHARARDSRSAWPGNYDLVQDYKRRSICVGRRCGGIPTTALAHTGRRAPIFGAPQRMGWHCLVLRWATKLPRVPARCVSSLRIYAGPFR